MPFYKGKKGIAIPRSRYLENIAKRNGWRHRIFTVGPTEESYKGQWKDDVKSGKGELVSSGRKKLLYEGDFERNHREGFGVLAREIDSLRVYELVYRGDWKNGKMHGYGLKVYKNGSYYIGQWRYGQREGLGKMWYQNGSYYEGEWHLDKREGLGLLVRSDGNRYEGNWKNGLKDGRGIFLHLDSGQLQTGIWKKDLCCFSRFSDLQFRQTCLKPTKYAIKPVELKFFDEVCEVQENKVLENISDLCMPYYSQDNRTNSDSRKIFLVDSFQQDSTLSNNVHELM